jgi:NitT/TauT family transport system permease protein
MSLRSVRARRLELRSFAVLGMLVVWEALVRLLSVPDYLVPAPSEIGLTVVGAAGLLAHHAVPTLLETGAGFLLGNLIGLVVAIVLSQASTVERSLLPLLVTLRSIPVIAITPLLMLVLGRGAPTLVTIVALICFFPIVVNATRGFAAADADVLHLLRLCGASRWQTLALVRLPYALPYIFSALKVSATAAVLGAVVAEWLVADQGLGFFIEDSRLQWHVADMWAGIVVTTLLAVLAFTLVGAVERQLAWWSTPAARTSTSE